MKFPENVFKAYDIRGKELNTELAQAVGRAFADFLPLSGPVAVGRDMRPQSAALAQAVINGLVQQGREVWDIGLVTSDMIYFAVGHYKMAGGAMVTASHNPGADDGIKLCGGDARPVGVDSGLADIMHKIATDNYKARTPGAIKALDVSEEWVAHALSFINAKDIKLFRVGIDAGNGMAGLILPKLAKRLPIRLEPLYFDLDGTFPNHPANPLELENLRDLIKKIQTDELDFGIAFDGDGDRAFFVDAAGNQISGSTMAAVLSEHLLKKHPGATILYSGIQSRIVPETILKAGGKPVRTKVGHSYIKADMRKYNALFASELSGHFYFHDNFDADSGLIAMLLMIEAISQSGSSLEELGRRFRKYSNSGELNFTVKDPAAKMKQLADKYKDGKQDTMDGLTVNYQDWWFNVRVSNTEAVFRLNVEAITPQMMWEKTIELMQLIRA